MTDLKVLLLDLWHTSVAADYVAALLHADWSFGEVMKSWCVLLLGLYFGKGCLCVVDRGISLTWMLWPAASGSQQRQPLGVDKAKLATLL